MSLSERISGLVTGYSKLTVLLVVVLSLGVVFGVTMMPEEDDAGSLDINTTEEDKRDYIFRNYRLGTRNFTATKIYVRNESGNVLSKKSLLNSLQLQRSFRQNKKIRKTLTEKKSTYGASNAIAHHLLDDENATIQEQINAIKNADKEKLNSAVSEVLGEDDKATVYMATSYEPGSTKANGRQMVVRQIIPYRDNTDVSRRSSAIAETKIRQKIKNEPNHFSVDRGAFSEEFNSALSDSTELVGPLALLFIIITLAIAYRDIVDIILGFTGVILTLLWTFGFMGWAGIPYESVHIATITLLIGLSIDYSIHTFMRYREKRAEGLEVGEAMKEGLGRVGVALILVTATAGIGFLSNITASFSGVRNFGIATTFGIVSALVIFTTIIPALKVEIDSILTRFGFERKQRVIGSNGGRISNLLLFGVKAAKKSPAAVIAVTLIVTLIAGGVATQVDTTTSRQDRLPQDPPDFTHNLPEPFATEEYTLKEKFGFVNEEFRNPLDVIDTDAMILVEGDVTSSETLKRLKQSRKLASNKETIKKTPSGEPVIRTPLTVMMEVASKNRTFRMAFEKSDTDGDGVPDKNLKRLYTALYQVSPLKAVSVIERKSRGYGSFIVTAETKESMAPRQVTSDMRDLASKIEDDGNAVNVTATGDTVVDTVVRNRLVTGIFESLLIALFVVFLLLLFVYRIAEGKASLGAVALIPVILVVAWIFGTMYFFNISLNLTTGLIASLTVGLGVDYSIHLSERFADELEQNGTVWEALDVSAQNTGGALLGSTATTAGAFGTLSLSILPPLRQFGLMIGLSLVYALIATLLIFPSILVIWSRFTQE